MKALFRAGLILVLNVLTVAAAPAPAHSQTFTRLAFQDGKDTKVVGLCLQLHEPDDPAKPTLWQGPLSIAGSSGSCNIAASLISSVFLSSTGRLAVLVSVSGSKTTVGFFNTHTCAGKWPPVTAFSSGVFIQRNLLELHPACEAAKIGYSCSAASVYRLSDSSAPVRLAADSLALTKEIFGVAFTGSRIFEHPPASFVPAK